MKMKLEEIKEVAAASSKSIETMYVVADFTKILTFEDYTNTIESKLRDLDVSMLIINAGMGKPGPFVSTPQEVMS